MIIPPIARKEWSTLLNGELNVSLRNFFFQMKVTQARTQINNGTVSMETAISDLHTLCGKFSKAKNMDEDMKSIFGADYMNEIEPIPIHIDLEKNIELKYEEEILFYKKALERKETIVQEKNNLIITLQEEVIFLKEKVSILYEGLKEIEEMQDEIKEENKNVVIEEKVEKEAKAWSFFNIFKK